MVRLMWFDNMEIWPSPPPGKKKPGLFFQKQAGRELESQMLSRISSRAFSAEIFSEFSASSSARKAFHAATFRL